MNEPTIKPPRITAERLYALSVLNAGTVPGEAMRDAAEEIDRLTSCISDGRWVPVTERALPKDDGSYLVTDGKYVAPMVRALIENNVGTPWDWDFGAKITHWMPLPGAPK